MAGQISPADDGGSSVKVVVRVRPLLGHEKVERCRECLSVVEGEPQIVIGVDRSFTFDYVFSKYAQQADFWTPVAPLVEAAFQGYNATIFAYGQTGSGKTFTMGSGSNLAVLEEDRGIIPRVIANMFDQIERKTKEVAGYSYEFKVRFLEIYGEEIRDLLDPLSGRVDDSKVVLREGENGEVLVVGAKEESIQGAEEFMRLLEKGTLCRTTGSTLMNASSSRSHAILTVVLKQEIPAQDQDKEIRTSSFNFVDLAGSERQKRTQAEGQRLKEGIEINKGLLALGNVISALGDDKKRGRVHVPYRDSKLTRMLQDSLGGNSRTLMITCVSPADVNFEETLNALKYANRARNIRNKPVVNRDSGGLVIELKRQIQLLQSELLTLKGMDASEGSSLMAQLERQADPSKGAASIVDSVVTKLRAEQAEKEVQRLTNELRQLRSQASQYSELLILAQAERDFYKIKLDDTAKPDSSSSNSFSVMPSSPIEPSSLSVDTAPSLSGMDKQSLTTSNDPGASELEENEGRGVEQKEKEKLEMTGIIADYLRTIADLKEKLRAADSRREEVMLESHYGGRYLNPKAQEEPEISNNLLEEELSNNSLDNSEEIGWKSLPQTSALPSEGGGLLSAGNEEAVEDDLVTPRRLHSEEEPVALFREEGVQEEEEVEKQRVFQHRQRQLGASVMDLSRGIALKEELVQELEKRTQKQLDLMKDFYEQKLAQMNEEVIRATQDREKLLRELQALEHRSEADKKTGNYEQLQKKLKDKDSELVELKKRQKELEKYSRMKQKSEIQMRQLYTEISNMKKQRVELLKKMDKEKKAYQQQAAERRKEIVDLRRDKQNFQNKVRQLGGQLEAQDRVLRRRIEEVTAANKRLRQQFSSAITREEMKKKKWLDQQVKKLAERQRRAEQLEQELTKREAIINKMEDLHAKRKKLQDDVAQAASIRDVLTSSVSGPKFLSSEEECALHEIEERIETCQEQLKYKEEKISEMAKDVEDHDLSDSSSASPLQRISTSSLPETRVLLRLLFDMLVHGKASEAQQQEALASWKQKEEDSRTKLEQAQDQIQQLKMQYDQRLTVLQKEQEERLNFYMTFYSAQQGHQESAAGISTTEAPQPNIVAQIAEERISLVQERNKQLEAAQAEHVQRMKEVMEEKRRQGKVNEELQAKIESLQKEVAQMKERLADKDIVPPAPTRLTVHTNGRSSPRRSMNREGSPNPSGYTTPPATHNPISPPHHHRQRTDHLPPAPQRRMSVTTSSEDSPVLTVDRANLGSPAMESTARSRSAPKHFGHRTESANFTTDDEDDDNLHYGAQETDYGDRERDRERERAEDSEGGSEAGAGLRLGSEASSIFDRLANPKNFTGMHKQRALETQKKRDEMKELLEKARQRRRVRDRSDGLLSPGDGGSMTRGSRIPEPGWKRNSSQSAVDDIEGGDVALGAREGAEGEPPSMEQDATNEMKDVYTRLALQKTVSAENRIKANEEQKHFPKGDVGRIIGWDPSGKPIGWDSTRPSTSLSKLRVSKPAFYVPIGPLSRRPGSEQGDNSDAERLDKRSDNPDTERSGPSSISSPERPHPRNSHRRSLSHNDAPNVDEMFNPVDYNARELLGGKLAPEQATLSGDDKKGEIEMLEALPTPVPLSDLEVIVPVVAEPEYTPRTE